jgi:hypothetical protein
MTMTIRPVSTKEFIGLSETKTIGYYGGCRAVAMPGAAVFIYDHVSIMWPPQLAPESLKETRLRMGRPLPQS